MEIANLIENAHFDVKRKTRIKSDASHNGLSTMLQKLQKKRLEIGFIRYSIINPHEANYSTNEIELLGVAWAVEHYKNTLYGSKYEIITNHKDLLSALTSNHGNKTYHSRITRWVDRLFSV